MIERRETERKTNIEGQTEMRERERDRDWGRQRGKDTERETGQKDRKKKETEVISLLVYCQKILLILLIALLAF